MNTRSYDGDDLHFLHQEILRYNSSLSACEPYDNISKDFSSVLAILENLLTEHASLSTKDTSQLQELEQLKLELQIVKQQKVIYHDNEQKSYLLNNNKNEQDQQQEDEQHQETKNYKETIRR